ncbi:ATP-binding cassette domain-containing protein [Marinihelvus fidelis]|uniref:ATP-binding cassette domain-containing protein n=1 Tax=Marinihelvus fidelis TaxID=2613842 RepID=A0A5N0TC59_9GAMM|nr:ATP-binding cassette domain-containing protein [Marinihelvus fidelis]KAA9130919.1 ATP-binding cassette domain-containing protein [Marinihelvus fidelis]
MSSNHEHAIRLENVVFRRGDRAILDHVSLTIPRGAIAAVMGPSGVGKTTVLRLVSGQLRPDSGRVLVNGEDVSSMGRRALFRMRENLGFLLQNGALFTDLTVFENVATPLREHRDYDDERIEAIVSERLASVGLEGTGQLMPHELSGGMARRVALARAVALDPSIVLFDEPMAGLDPIAVSTINELIRRTNDERGLTSVVVTHDVEQMSRLADYCYILVDGRIAGEGPPSELADSPDAAVRQFMNGQMDGPIPFRYAGAGG